MWLALRFVHWALDCLADNSETPALVVQTVAQRQQVIAASPEALAAGVTCDMGLADARIRLHGVTVHERHAAAETAAMKRLAGWAWGYSDQVHWAIAESKISESKKAVPHIECTRLALEIGASLRLFGGRRALLARIRDDLNTLGYRYSAGVGDSPQAALAFARVQSATRHPRPRKGLQSSLAGLPIACLDLPSSAATSLAASGLSQVGELLALPPGTLARRYGSSVLDYLEQLRGRRPHGLALYRLPARYTTRYELIGAVETTQGLVFVLRRIFSELAVFLRGADSTIQTLRLSLIHDREPTTQLTLRLSAPSHDAHHLEAVAQERLAQLRLAAPVLEIGLASDQLRRSEHTQQRLWAHASNTQDDAWPAVLDRLRARLGHDAVTWLAAPADHRPGQATISVDCPSAAGSSRIDHSPRPLWMLEHPEPIQGELAWIGPAERVETGWWHSGIRRDYHRAMDHQGRLVWVFRDLQAACIGERRYYLHGLFG
jgi:protein ImuB